MSDKKETPEKVAAPSGAYREGAVTVLERMIRDREKEVERLRGLIDWLEKNNLSDADPKVEAALYQVLFHQR